MDSLSPSEEKRGVKKKKKDKKKEGGGRKKKWEGNVSANWGRKKSRPPCVEILFSTVKKETMT